MIESKKKNIIKYAKLFSTTRFSPLRSGNISIRHNLKNVNGFLITPSGKKNHKLRTNDIVFVSLDGIPEKNKKPSSEWKFHLDIYKSTKYNSVVHAHSKFSVICSCIFREIPAFHYMIALTGAKKIEVANYALFGSEKLSNNIIKILKRSKSCLIANHGQISIEKNLESAYELAEEVELLCEYYYYCRLKKFPKIISEAEMNKVLEKILDYKRK